MRAQAPAPGPRRSAGGARPAAEATVYIPGYIILTMRAAVARP
jgi:hypothetical protein